MNQVVSSLLKYPKVICAVYCAYLGTTLTNRNEWIPGIVNAYYAYSSTKEATVLGGKQ